MEPQTRLSFDCRLSLPNHALFVGASQSGKTTLCLKLLSNPQLFNPQPKKIIFHYDQFQDSYIETKKHLAKFGIELVLFKGVADISLESLGKQPEQTILLIDDFSEETSSNAEIARIATNGRHANISLWLVWHSLYSKHAASRIICQNVRWFFFLPSLRLESQLRTFGAQLGMKSRILHAFRACQEEENPCDTSNKYGYIVVDAGPRTPNIMRVRSNVHNLELQYCFT